MLYASERDYMIEITAFAGNLANGVLPYPVSRIITETISLPCMIRPENFPWTIDVYDDSLEFVLKTYLTTIPYESMSVNFYDTAPGYDDSACQLMGTKVYTRTTEITDLSGVTATEISDTQLAFIAPAYVSSTDRSVGDEIKMTFSIDFANLVNTA